MLLDSMDFESYEEVKDELEYILEDNADKLGALIAHRRSHYGAIGGNGKVGYRSNGSTLLNEILNVNADSLAVERIDGKLLVSFYDHDGVTECEVVTMNERQFAYIMQKDFDGIMHELNKLERI